MYKKFFVWEASLKPQWSARDLKSVNPRSTMEYPQGTTTGVRNEVGNLTRHPCPGSFLRPRRIRVNGPQSTGIRQRCLWDKHRKNPGDNKVECSKIMFWEQVWTKAHTALV